MSNKENNNSEHRRIGLINGLLFASYMLASFGLMVFGGFMEKEIGLTSKILRLITAIGLWSIAFFALWFALRNKLRFRRYLPIIKGNDKFFIQQIADITNTDTRDIINDLENMIKWGYIENYYIDFKKGLLINKNFIPKKTVQKTVECETCGAHNEVVIGQTDLYRCRSCGNPLILTFDYSEYAPSAHSTEHATSTNPVSTQTPNVPSSGHGWLGLAALAALALICFRRKN